MATTKQEQTFHVLELTRTHAVVGIQRNFQTNIRNDPPHRNYKARVE